MGKLGPNPVCSSTQNTEFLFLQGRPVTRMEFLTLQGKCVLFCTWVLYFELSNEKHTWITLKSFNAQWHLLSNTWSTVAKYILVRLIQIIYECAIHLEIFLRAELWGWGVSWMQSIILFLWRIGYCYCITLNCALNFNMDALCHLLPLPLENSYPSISLIWHDWTTYRTSRWSAPSAPNLTDLNTPPSRTASHTLMAQQLRKIWAILYIWAIAIFSM